MKKIILAVSFLFSFMYAFSQAVTQRSSSAVTVQDARLMAQYNMFVPRYLDTTAAMSGTNEGIDSCGAIIYCYSTNALYFRDCVGGIKHWVQVLPSGGSSGTQGWVVGYNNEPMLVDGSNNSGFGTTGNIGIDIKTSNVTRLILDKAGIMDNSVATTKILVVDTATRTIGYRAVSGLTPVNIYNSDGTLTGARTLNGDEFDLLFDNVNSFVVNSYLGSITGGFRVDPSSTVIAMQNGGKITNLNVFPDSIRFQPYLGQMSIDTLKLASSSTNRNLMTWNTTNGAWEQIAPSSIVTAAPTWQQTLTAGSTLNQDNNIDGGGHIFTFTNSTQNLIQTDNGSNFASLNINNGYATINATKTTPSKNSSFSVKGDTIAAYPYLGNYIIDTLTNNVGTHALRYNPTTGLVSYADTTSGGSVSAPNTEIVYGTGSGVASSPNFYWDGALNVIGSGIFSDGIGVTYIGDVSAASTGLVFHINPSGLGSNAYIDNTAHTGLFGINKFPTVALDVVGSGQFDIGSSGTFLVKNGSQDLLEIEATTPAYKAYTPLGQYIAGDVEAAEGNTPQGKGNWIKLDDDANTIELYASTTPAAGAITITANSTIASTAGDAALILSGGGGSIFGNTGVSGGFIEFATTGIFSAGDAEGNANNTKIVINDGTQDITLTSATTGISNLAGTGTRAVLAAADGTLSAPVSDISLKYRINPINNGINTIMKFRPVNFYFKKEYQQKYGDREQIGFIAQEVEKIIPNSVFTNNDGKKGYSEQDIIPILVKAAQEQQQIIKNQQKQIDELKKQVTLLKKRI